MAYQARRDDDTNQELENARSDAANQKAAKAGLKVVSNTGGWWGAAARAVDKADDISGGRITKAAGKEATKLNKRTPGGKRVQNLTNKFADSKAADAAMTAYNAKNGQGGSNAGEAAEKAQKNQEVAANAKKANEAADKVGAGGKKTDDEADKTKKAGRGQDSSLPSSDVEEDGSESTKTRSGIAKFIISSPLIGVTILLLPILFVLILFMVVGMVTGIFGDYEDAFGMGSTLGEENGEIVFTASSDEQQDFYERIQSVKLSYQAQGKTLDAMKMVAVYHALKANDVDIQYENVTESVIRQWADASFSGNYYDEEVFRSNLTYRIFPHYKPGESQSYYEEMTDEVFDYLDRYYNLIGKDSFGSSCASIGSCSYNIKGFYISGHGNMPKNIQVKDLRVRLMECGSPYGNGSYTKAIDQDLVDFEDYVAGVAYAEVGSSVNEEVLKAQMVAARSFALSRPTAMGSGSGKKLAEENGKWILQISSCVADQVFCNIDLGCSHMGGGDGQGGICRDGKVAGAVKTVDPLPSEHALRRAAAETQGEVLVNAQGYIISTGYNDTDQNEWMRLAASGLNYKQILLQTYNSSKHNDGATDIQKSACNSGGESSCISDGEFAKWKQTDPQWAAVPMGSSGKSLSQIGCLVTSVSMLIAKSGVPVNVSPWNPGTFVQFLNQHGGINSGGNFIWNVATQAAPSFHYQGQISVEGMSREAKLNKIKEIVSQQGVYAVVEVKGNTGQHWVAIDSVTGSTVNMMDPSTDATDMWAQYNWANTSTIAYYRVG